jgi:ribosomal protein S18 acetylase RimI-like enzyme
VPWTLTDDIEAYAERVGALLSADPARNTIALTVLGMLRAGHRYSDEPMLFGWYEGADGIQGAVFHTPPFYLELAVMPDAATHELVRALRAAGRAVTGINGDGAAVERFTAAWTAETGDRARTEFRLCLHELGALRPPEPAPAGAARPAREADVERAAGWYHAFQKETGTPGGADAEAMIRERLADGRLWVWEDDDGAMAALAARTAASGGVARIAPVYTPPEHRRRGYGAAVTAACTADALARDAERVVLFTDLANPTTNSIYRRLGFEPVAEHRVMAFEPPA